MIGRSRKPAGEATAGLADRLEALGEVVDHCAGPLPADELEAARQVLSRAGERRKLSGHHTVVALAGATGSGKSSLFNAVAGLDLAAVGVRRPTTAEPLACVWGAAGARELLDWLGIPQRHQVARESPLEPGVEEFLHGLVLLDLPDHDSTEVSHRLEVDRLVKLVDLFVWVVDPQKYADAVLHERYLRPLARHAPVTTVVLNQIDRLQPEGVQQCVDDIQRLLAEDGMAGVEVLPVSAKTGEGVDKLIQRLRDAVTSRRAATERLAADVSTAAGRLLLSAGSGDPQGVTSGVRRRLVNALAEAAGVNAVAHAVGASYRLRARAATGWPVTRWLSRLRRDPVKRYRLDREVAPRLVRTSLPAPTPVQRARAEAAVRQLVSDSAAGAPRRWLDAARAVGGSVTGRLPDLLDQTIARTDLSSRGRPLWWRALGVLQWLLFGAAVAGLVWLGVLFGLDYLRLPEPTTPSYFGFPLPTLLLAGGLAAGLLLGLLGRLPAAIGARRHARLARRRLHASIEQAADEHVIGPVSAELQRLLECRQAVRRAAGA